MDIDTDHVHINIHSADILPYYAVFVLSILKWKQKTFDHYFTLVCESIGRSRAGLHFAWNFIHFD